MHLESSFFEEILRKVPAEIIVADAEFRYLFVNPSAVPDPVLREWMIGRTNEEFCLHAGRPPRYCKGPAYGLRQSDPDAEDGGMDGGAKR